MDSVIKVAAVVAMAKNRCIGKDNDLPWHIPADLKRFKNLTTGKPVIMGRKTYESIFSRLGKPLPNRANIIISRSLPPTEKDDLPAITADGPFYCASLDDALAFAWRWAKDHEQNEVIIGGGAQIYTQAMPYTDVIYVTEVQEDVEGDAFFPQWDDQEWDTRIEEEHDAVSGQHAAFVYKTISKI